MSNEITKEKRELLYQVVTKRDEQLLEAFITFDYRVVHPKVGLRFVLYAAVFFTFASAAGFSGLGAASFGIGALCILFVLIRKYISLSMTKKDDKDYQNGTTYEYDFYENGAMMLREGKLEVPVKNYKKGITGFYSDQNFFYLIVNSDDLFILPKSRFTAGDPAEFEKFINEKTKLTSIWIPSGAKGVIYRITNFLTKPIIDPSRRKNPGGQANTSGSREKADGETWSTPTAKPKNIKRLESKSTESNDNDEKNSTK